LQNVRRFRIRQASCELIAIRECSQAAAGSRGARTAHESKSNV
jgi:hypothetical protein